MGANKNYEERNLSRQTQLNEATVSFEQYFINLGDDLATAKSKISQLSSEIAQFIYPYILGNMALITEINASELAFMDADAKAFITNALTL
jgi:hypothetical protein